MSRWAKSWPSAALSKSRCGKALRSLEDRTLGLDLERVPPLEDLRHLIHAAWTGSLVHWPRPYAWA